MSKHVCQAKITLWRCAKNCLVDVAHVAHCYNFRKAETLAGHPKQQDSNLRVSGEGRPTCHVVRNKSRTIAIASSAKLRAKYKAPRSQTAFLPWCLATGKYVCSRCPCGMAVGGVVSLSKSLEGLQKVYKRSLGLQKVSGGC